MAIQWKVPGLTVFVSLLDGLPIAMHLWYLHDSVAYYHLGASNQDGYRVGANFALMMAAIEYFSDQGHRWLALGGEAGLHSKEDGLTRFKRGWSTDTRMAYFCGRVLQPARYAQLVRSRNVSSDYFPQYRTPLNSRAAA
jgi:lipid II:glycine glycyltransferase (peptidoglycan interpeptide bridge formation enzyme)